MVNAMKKASGYDYKFESVYYSLLCEAKIDAASSVDGTPQKDNRYN